MAATSRTYVPFNPARQIVLNGEAVMATSHLWITLGLYRQPASELCWAACALEAHSYWQPNSPLQTVPQMVGHILGPHCQDNVQAAACNQPQNIQAVLQALHQWDYTMPAQDLSPGNLLRYLGQAQGSLLIAQMVAGQGTPHVLSHYVIIRGYTTAQNPGSSLWLHTFDPLNGTERNLKYPDLVNGYPYFDPNSQISLHMQMVRVFSTLPPGRAYPAAPSWPRLIK